MMCLLCTGGARPSAAKSMVAMTTKKHTYKDLEKLVEKVSTQ